MFYQTPNIKYTERNDDLNYFYIDPELFQINL